MNKQDGDLPIRAEWPTARLDIVECLRSVRDQALRDVGRPVGFFLPPTEESQKAVRDAMASLGAAPVEPWPQDEEE